MIFLSFTACKPKTSENNEILLYIVVWKYTLYFPLDS
jgi:hypothetical protein